jgi:hypothetical protein
MNWNIRRRREFAHWEVRERNLMMRSSRNLRARSIALGTAAMMAIAVVSGSPAAYAKQSKSSLPATVAGISASDKQTGAKAHPELLAEFGGAMTGSQAAYARVTISPSPCSTRR